MDQILIKLAGTVCGKIEMEVAADKWNAYTDGVVDIMAAFLNRKINIIAAFDEVGLIFKGLSRSIDDKNIEYFEEINQDILNIISEIDGNHEGYLEVLDFLRKHPTPIEFKEFRDRPLFW